MIETGRAMGILDGDEFELWWQLIRHNFWHSTYIVHGNKTVS